MKALIGSLAALAVIASPAYAQNNTMAPEKAPAHHKASSKMAKEAKSEGESTATEAKEHKAAAHHGHHAARCSCGHYKGKAHKSTKTTKTTKKTSTSTTTPQK